MEDVSNVNMEAVLNSLSDGVYVCDLERRITYWNKAAERITGWRADEVVGGHCFDSILCHMDKDGHSLCGTEYCPLHRAMVTETVGGEPMLVYAQARDGRRIPTHATVAPLRNKAGKVIGGVETFRDASKWVDDLERAQAIQQRAMKRDVGEDVPANFSMLYVPRDIVGGDYYAIGKLDENEYGIMLADVKGHGVTAAVYTMYLSSLWDRYYPLLKHPVEFASKMNMELGRVIKGEISFAAALCGVVNLADKSFRFTSAGGPEVLVGYSDGRCECIASSGLPWGLVEGAQYDEVRADIKDSESLLLFTDGAVEVRNADKEVLGVEGLVDILRKQDYPEASVRMDVLEEELLRYSNAIRLDDDLTVIEVRFD